MDPRERAVLPFILVTALRPSELFALRWRDFDMKKGTITISETIYRGVLRPFMKTTQEGETRGLPLHVPDEAVVSLAKWHTETKHREDDDFIFPNTGGLRYKENYQRRVLSLLAEEPGIKRLNFQILRRTVATHAQDLGTPKDIQAVMCHKKAETAQAHYVQAIDKNVKAMTNRLAAKLLSK